MLCNTECQLPSVGDLGCNATALQQLCAQKLLAVPREGAHGMQQVTEIAHPG